MTQSSFAGWRGRACGKRAGTALIPAQYPSDIIAIVVL